MNGVTAEKMLAALGEVLEQQGSEPIDLLVCGGMALVLQGHMTRLTRDIDVLAVVVPEEDSLTLRKPLLSRDFTMAVERVGVVFGRGRNWFNFAAVLLHDETRLPPDMLERSVVKQYGRRLTIRLCARKDMVCLKMWAAINRSGPDVNDLVEMKVSEQEAQAGFEWCIDQGGSRESLLVVIREVGHAELAERLS